MVDDRLCPKCLAGRLRVRTSTTTPGGQWRRQYLICPKCGGRTSRMIKSSLIFTRQKKFPNVGKAPTCVSHQHNQPE